MADRFDTRALDRILKTALKVAGVPGLALAVATTEQTYAQGYGIRCAGGGDAVTPDTLFAGASITKPFTATAIALLVDRGKLSWDEPIRRYLPEFRMADPVADSQVTLRDLVTHRTGLPRNDYLWYRSGYSRQEVLRRIGNLKHNEPFRTRLQYQNLGFMVAGEVIRAVSGADFFESFLQKELLLPLGMTRSNLSIMIAEADSDHTEPHQRINGKLQQGAWPGFDVVAGCGGLNSCATDMVKWLQFHLNQGKTLEGNQLLSPTALQETYQPQTILMASPGQVDMACCLAWGLKHYQGHPLLCHGGAAIDGFRSYIEFAPRVGIGFCLFANLNGAFFTSVSNAIRQVLLETAREDWISKCKAEIKKERQEEREAEAKRKSERKNGKSSPLPLKDYVGQYECPAYGLLTVEAEKQGSRDRLRLSWNHYNTGLQHQTFSTFVTTDQKEVFDTNKAAFEISPAGEIRSLSLFGTTFERLAPSQE
jgi:CubicO group peptidase (beta-lactamase class C family)